MLRARILTALVAIPFLLWLIFRGPDVILKIFVLTITFVALREFSTMALRGVPGAATMVAAAGMTIACAVGLFPGGQAVSAAIVIALAGILVGTLATAEDMEASVNRAGQVLLGALYAGFLLPHFIRVQALGVFGPWWVVFILACCMGGDAGGYFGGRAFGKRKLWPAVSPNKTVEGAISSFFCSLIVGTGVNAVAHSFVGRPLLGPVETFVIAGIINVLAQLGDLLESMVKRAYDADDSGWIFPGHGGVLDRTDSLVLPVVFVYYYADSLRQTLLGP